ncbi:unnamed protein product [Ectocarpus sp. CCAP 1310/34]|nr:unnamed protein product [Ectocarpus sp. CCAP 1310/34]
MARATTAAAVSSSHATSYRWCYVEQVDQAEPLAGRSNGWRYMGPGGVTYRRQAVFGTGFRIRISFPSSPGPGHRWFNSHPLGGDPNLYNFQTWARTVLQRGMLVVSAADDTWRVILCWASAGRRIDVDTQGIPISLVNLQVRSGVDSQSPFFRQLNIATFGHRVVRYAPITAFGKKWQEQLPGACLAVLVADAWRDSQVDLLKARERRRFGFRDGAPVQNKNALDGGNYFRNLYSILLERDIGEVEFDKWVSGDTEPPALTLLHLEKWLHMTKASVVVWSHRGTGANILGPPDGKTNLRPPTVHVGVREGHVYRLVLEGPWRDRFGSSLDVAIEHREPDPTGFGAKTFSCVADIVSDIMAIKQTGGDHSRQPVEKKRKHGRKVSECKTWYAPPGTALDELMLHLHLAGVSCKGKLTNYSRWDSLSLPAHGLIIRTWFSASMGGLDPDDFEPDQATRLIELHNALGLKFCRGVLDFRVSSQYSKSLLALLEVCWRGPIVGAEDASGSSYGREDWQCDINGAHTAALMNMETVPVFGHMDEVEEFDGHNIEDWTLYIIKLDALVTHYVGPSRTVSRCHIPKLMKDLLTHELGDPLLEDADYARRVKKRNIRAGQCDEASAVGGKIVPVLCEVDRVKAELRTGQGDLGIDSLRTGNAYLCFDAERTWYRDGFWALRTLTLDETRLRVLEARNALESCGASDFSYQCDAVFFRGSSSVQEKMVLRFDHLFTGDEKTPGTLKFGPALKNPLCGERRVCIVVKLSLDALPSAMRKIPCPFKPPLSVIPLWDGIGTSFHSMEGADDAWRRLGKNTKRDLWPEICEAEIVCAVTGEHGGAGKSYCTIRAATATFETGLVLTPTNSLRTSYTNLPSGWSVKTADHQLGFYLSDDSYVKKTAGSIRTLKVDVIIIEEAAYMPLRTLSMILAAAHSSGTHVIGTYDTHQLQPVCDSSGMSISRDNVDRKVILEKAFPTCFHVFARKRDKTIEDQVEMDDGLLHILAAGNDSDEAQTRAIERFGGEHIENTSPSDFHLAYTRECARFHAFEVCWGAPKLGTGMGWGVGAQYRDLGNPDKVHKNHMYNVIRSSADTVVVASAFDDGASLEETSLCRAEAENVFDPPGSCTVHAVQGRTVEGSRATGPSNVRVIDDIHRSESDMSDRERVSWVSRKASSYIYADVAAGRIKSDEGGQHREALVQELHRSYGGRCNLCNHELTWTVYSERQPTLDRLDCALPHTIGNVVDVKCLKCNRARGSLGRGKSKKRKIS